MKHKSVNLMLANPNDLMAEYIADYAVFNTTDNDATKTRNIIELIIAYSKSERALLYTAEQVVQIANNWKHGGGSIYAYLRGGNMVGHNKLYTTDEVREINNAFKRDVIKTVNGGGNDFDIAALDIDQYLTK